MVEPIRPSRAPARDVWETRLETSKITSEAELRAIVALHELGNVMGLLDTERDGFGNAANGLIMDPTVVLNMLDGRPSGPVPEGQEQDPPESVDELTFSGAALRQIIENINLGGYKIDL